MVAHARFDRRPADEASGLQREVAGGILLRRRLNRRPQRVTRSVVGSCAGRAS
jgi:hypothetical protein